MEQVTIETHDRVALVRLKNGVTNALGPTLVADMLTALEQVKRDFGGMVLAGGEKFFSMGLDLPNLLKLDRSAMNDFWHDFSRSILMLYCLPVPTACAMRGHTIAGGTIYALTADFRWAAEGKAIMGLNEVKLGVPAPYLADLMLRQIVGDRQATAMIYSGDFVGMPKAAEIGLVDGIFAAQELETKAIEVITGYATLPAKPIAVAKATRVEEIVRRYEQNRQSAHDDFIDCWFEPQTQDLLTEAAAKF